MQLSVCFANPYHPTAIACEVEQKMKPTEERVAGLLLVRLALLCPGRTRVHVSQKPPEQDLHIKISL